MQKISIIGAGYVGLVTAASFASLGFSVVCADIDRKKVEKINRKEPPIYEENLQELLERAVPKKLSATTKLKSAILGSGATFICVGTPSQGNGMIYLEAVRKASMELGLALKEKKTGHLIIVKSTVVPETTEKLIIPEIEKFSGKRFGRDFGVVVNPEFLREGTAIADFLSPDRIVLGSTDARSIRAARNLYSWAECPIVECSFREAEMAKYASNAFLATKISFINDIGNICKKLSIDTNKIAYIMGLDSRIGKNFLKAGIGFGGSCLPKDLRAIIQKAEEKDYSPELLSSVLEVNMKQPSKLIEMLDEKGMLSRKTRVGILGLTFKANTDDIRESPSLEVIKLLTLRGVQICAYDPKGMAAAKRIFPKIRYKRSAQQVADESTMILILSEWPEFKKVDFRGKQVIDGKNLFGEGERPGNYEGLCW
jgi:UDPglucose 6-dehydrogenase